jgi:DNA (cytosine-5)-methyltransferase 1
LNYLSVCSGIEAATVAWHDLGWKPVGFSEIEKFPSQVLAHHYPTVTNFGDMTKYKEWQIDGTVGLLVGGTPCQSFSVAGLRKGLEDPRGNLALTYVGILDRFRPEWCIWENVPGVLSSGGGRDFGSFLGALAELGYGWAYRVLDAQNFGVAQRRRRVFVVGHLGDWKPAAEVLFESESLRGDIKKGRGERKDIANCLTKSPSSYSSYNPARTEGNAVVAKVYENHPADSRITEMGDVCSTVTSRWGTGGGNVPLTHAYGFNTNARPDEMKFLNEKSNTLTSSQNSGIAQFVDTYNGTIQGDVSATMTADMAGPTHSGPKVMQNMAVRRLTPIECERLQGFPDNYTNILKAADGNRYKALGNSMAVPVMRWIGERINQYEREYGRN